MTHRIPTTKREADTILCADKNGRLYERRKRPGDITVREWTARRIASAAKARKAAVVVRWCYMVVLSDGQPNGSMDFVTKARAIAARNQEIRDGFACGPVERHEFTLPAPKKASKP